MPINPCGRVVDYIRRPYSTLARFFKDDEGPPVEIQWYAAAADAPTLGRGTSFLALDWTSETSAAMNPNWPDEPWLQRPGEIFDTPRPFALWPTPLGLDYAHICGTDDEFLNGAVFDPLRVVKYDEQGLPLCCGGPVVPAFPLMLGFDVTFPVDPTPDCEDSPAYSLGQWFEWQQPPGHLGWVHWAVVPGRTYRCRYIDDGPINFSFTSLWFAGPTTCPGTIFASANHLSPLDTLYTPIAGEVFIAVRMDNPSLAVSGRHWRLDDVTP